MSDARRQQNYRENIADNAHKEKERSVPYACGMAHQFNNWLTAIVGNTELALNTLPETHAANTLLKESLVSAGKAARLTSELLAYAGKSRFVARHINLSAVIEKTVPFLQDKVPAHIRLNWELDGELPLFWADPGQIEHALTNLLLNAVEAIGSHRGVLTVGTGRERSAIYVEVRDSGPGVPEQFRHLIWNRFSRQNHSGAGWLSCGSGNYARVRWDFCGNYGWEKGYGNPALFSAYVTIPFSMA